MFLLASPARRHSQGDSSCDQRHAGTCHEQGGAGRVVSYRILGHAVGDPVPAHQEPMRVDAVGRARDERAVVLLRVDGERLHVVRVDGENLVDLVRQGPVEHGEGEGVRSAFHDDDIAAHAVPW